MESVINERFGEEYFENGIVAGISLYQNYRWIPELTIPMAYFLVQSCGISHSDSILDFGCAKGYLVRALRLLKFHAYGVDISRYAISQAPSDVRNYIKRINPGFDQELMTCDWVIAKDVLEHIDPREIDSHLMRLSNITNNIYVIVPLAREHRYIIPSNELDVTHKIRESLDWWIHKLENVGFRVEGGYYSGNFKETSAYHPRGIGLLIGRKP